MKWDNHAMLKVKDDLLDNLQAKNTTTVYLSGSSAKLKSALNLHYLTLHFAEIKGLNLNYFT